MKYLFILVFLPHFAFAQGGPPLVTDDPGTPGDGHWEINIATNNQYSASSSLFQIPYFDINYGWGDRLQLKYETGGALFSGTQSTGTETNLKYGWGPGLAGVKWRYLENADQSITLSTYPQYYFSYFLTSSDPDLGQPGNWFLLPLEFAFVFKSFTFNPEIGYEFYWQGPNQVVAGSVFSYKIKATELLAEIHDNSKVDGSGSYLLYNLGFRYDFSDSLTLLFSVGHTLQTFSTEEAQGLSYLGLQVRI